MERVSVSFSQDDGKIGDREECVIRQFCRSRNPLLFEELITPHLAWLRRLFYAIFNGNPEDMEDAEQEVLSGIFQDLKHFQFKSSFKTFFYRYARNKAVDLVRKCARRRRFEQRGEVKEKQSAELSPEAQYLKKEEKKGVLEALLTLDPEDRGLVLMKDVEDFSIEEIANMTGLKEGTVKSRLHRTREKLYRLLERR